MRADTLEASRLRSNLRDVLNRVEYNGVHVVIHRRGKVAGVLVPKADYDLMEELLDRSDAKAAKKALAEPGRVAWRDVKRNR